MCSGALFEALGKLLDTKLDPLKKQVAAVETKVAGVETQVAKLDPLSKQVAAVARSMGATAESQARASFVYHGQPGYWAGCQITNGERQAGAAPNSKAALHSLPRACLHPGRSPGCATSPAVWLRSAIICGLQPGRLHVLDFGLASCRVHGDDSTPRCARSPSLFPRSGRPAQHREL